MQREGRGLLEEAEWVLDLPNEVGRGGGAELEGG